VPAPEISDLMVLVESRNPVENHQMFEESWEAGPVCDVSVLLHGDQISNVVINLTRQDGRYLRVVNGHCSCRSAKASLSRHTYRHRHHQPMTPPAGRESGFA
jgi:hypothetical protein